MCRFARDVTEAGEDGAGGGEERIFAGGVGELHESWAEYEAALEVAAHEAVELERYGEPMRSGARETRRRHEARQREGLAFEGAQHSGCLVEYAHSTASFVNMLRLAISRYGLQVCAAYR